MAEQQGMISPFEPGQVREQEGQRIISYGTSSYGYDVRCSTEFKIVWENLPMRDAALLLMSHHWNQNGKARSPWSSPIPRHYLPKFMLTKV